MKPELINTTETEPEKKQIETYSPDAELTVEVANSLFSQRFSEAEQLQPFISLKFYYAIKEKIVREQAAARKLLQIEENKQEILDKYSFILNPSYFEQKTLA